MYRSTQAQAATRLLLNSMMCQYRLQSTQSSSHCADIKHTSCISEAPSAATIPAVPQPLHKLYPTMTGAPLSDAATPFNEATAAAQLAHDINTNDHKKVKVKKKQNKSQRNGDTEGVQAATAAGHAHNGTALPFHADAALLSSIQHAATTPLPKTRTILDFPDAYQSFPNVTPMHVFSQRYGDIANDKRHATDSNVRVAGRLVSVRDMGRILFLTLRSGVDTVQVIRQVDDTFTKTQLRSFTASLQVGDVIGASGTPGRTKRGELSLYVTEAVILAPYVCTDQALCPDLKGFVPLTDTDIKYRYRFIDMMSSPEVVRRIKTRHTITKALRNFLDSHDFVEVETPVLHAVASGANARPFTTHHNANDADLYLRVAPELHLKQCVVGGLDRVYEIGRVFRNEDADRSHNPEFTTCEFYAAYHTYEDLMGMTEEIMRHLAMAANGTTKITVKSCVTQEATELDLARPFRRVNAYDEVQLAAGVELPPPLELNTPRGMAYMSAIMLRYSIPLPSVRTAAKMFDKLIDYFITDRVIEPTFVTDHPLFMSPLALERHDRPGLSARFELFINGTEYCNAYSELNDPQEQYYRFQQQLLDKQTGDDEAMSLDETFLKALQVGLPPTAGWGMGMDRVVTFLNGSATIRDDIIFPLLRQDASSHDAKRRCKTASFFGFNHNMTLFCLNALEEEMRKRSAPQESLEKLRQLRDCIRLMPQRDGAPSLPRGTDVRGWRYEATMAVLRLFCYRGKY